MVDPLQQWLALVFSHPDWAGALAIAAKSAVIYVFVILGLRLLGKRELGQISNYDLALIVILANAVQNALVGNDTTLLGGITSAATLLALNRVFTWVVIQKPELRRWIEGEPVLIVRDGKLLTDHMKKEGVTREHVLAAMREHGIGELDKVQMAVLEVDGTISIIARDAEVYRTHRHFRGLDQV
jgi:uncharacterized membrane protein YcaP (DUF421 family)